MKIAMGANVKVTVGEPARGQVRAMFEALGVRAQAGHLEHVDVFVLDDGGRVGFFFVSPSEALTEAQLASSVWLELRVADVEGATRALDALSIPREPYADAAHAYFRAPGGLVLRVAALG